MVNYFHKVKRYIHLFQREEGLDLSDRSAGKKGKKLF